MSRNVLVIGGGAIVVLGLLGGLWFLLMKNDDASARNPAPPPVLVDKGPPAAPHGGTTTTPGTVEPVIVPPPGSGDNPREYQVGGITVRDHRSGDHKQLDVPLNIHEPGGHAIQSATTNVVSLKLQAVMKQCTASLAKDARGDKPRLEGQVMVAIKDNKVTVQSATVQLRNVADAAAAPIKQCIEEHSVGIQDAAANESDVENYPINISFAIP